MVFRGRFKAGERVLIHGGSSGIGTTAIQMAKALGAAQVVVTVRTPEKAEACLRSALTTRCSTPKQRGRTRCWR